MIEGGGSRDPELRSRACQGTIVKVHTKDVNYKGYTHHASKDESQYEIQSNKTDHIAVHKGSALKRSND